MSHYPQDLLVEELNKLFDKPLADFVYQCIAALMHKVGCNHDAIRGTPRSITDGGKDWMVEEPFTNDSGFFTQKTLVQVKGVPREKNVTKIKSALKGEFKGQGVIEKIEAGYQYVAAVNQDLTDNQQADLEAEILKHVQGINSDAPPPKVMHYLFYRDVCRQVPSILLTAGFGRPLRALAKPFTKWDEDATRNMPEYVPVASRATVVEEIHRLCDFGQDQHLFQQVRGAAGIGKTRLVLEAIRSAPNAEVMTLYTDESSNARQVFLDLQNLTGSCILVADECELADSFYMEERVRDAQGRIRIICIDKPEEIREPDGQSILDRIPNDEFKLILEANRSNYPELSDNQIDQIVDLAGGYIRFADDMCRNAHYLEGPEVGRKAKVRRYLNMRFAKLPDHKEMLKLLSLVRFVGYRAGKSPGLGSLLDAASNGTSEEDAFSLLRELKDAPGFVNVLERVLYITPAVVAEIFFAWAWDEVRDPEQFVAGLSGDLLEGFLYRVRMSGSPEVQKQVAGLFQLQLQNASPGDLQSELVCQRIRQVVEMSPSDQVGILESLLAQCENLGYLGDRYDLEEE